MGTQIAGVIFEHGSNGSLVIPKMAIENADIVINDVEGAEDFVWSLGIDQSTSCTGIALLEHSRGIVYMFDIHRDKNLPDSVFYKDLKQFLVNISKGNKFEAIAYEKPIPKAKFRSAQNKLFELKGKLEEWMLDIPEWSNVYIDSFLPQSWKSVVMDKSETGKNRARDKYEVATDICKIYNEATTYKNSYPFTDFDSFDALGLITALYRIAFQELEHDDGSRDVFRLPDGSPVLKIHGTMEKRHNCTVYASPVDKSLDLYEALGEVFGDLCRLSSLSNTPFVLFNQQKTLSDNARIATSMFDSAIFFLPDEELDLLKWEYEIDEGKSYLALVVYQNKFSKSDLDCFDGLFKIKKEVYGD